MKFEKEYFDNHYGDVRARNPERKLSFLLQSIKRFKEKGKLLDIGFGYGSFLRYAGNAFAVYGLDNSEYTVNTIKQHIKNIKKGSAEKLPFKQDFFDVVTAFDVLEHVPALDTAFLECKRVLKKGGIFMIVVPVYDGISGPFIRALDKDRTHLHKRTRRFWIKKIQEHGFTLLECGGIFRYLFMQHYFHIPTKNLRNHAPALYLVCKK